MFDSRSQAFVPVALTNAPHSCIKNTHNIIKALVTSDTKFIDSW